jgi:hypothetical protein
MKFGTASATRASFRRRATALPSVPRSTWTTSKLVPRIRPPSAPPSALAAAARALPVTFVWNRTSTVPSS